MSATLLRDDGAAFAARTLPPGRQQLARRLSTRIVGALAAAALGDGSGSRRVPRPASAQDGDVTLTVGLTQDMSSPNVTVGYLVSEFEVWNLQYATLTDKAADDFATIPAWPSRGKARDDGLTYTYTLREGLEVVRRRAAHRRGHRLHDQPVARRGVAQPLLDGRRTSTATAIDDRTVEIDERRCPIRSCRRWTCTSSPSTSTSRLGRRLVELRRARRRRLRARTR